jgi:transcriptional regulator with XRE-family HTH domain
MRADEFLRHLEEAVQMPPNIVAEIDAPFDLAKNVYRLRVRCGMTQSDLAKLAGIRQPRIAEIERGDANPRLRTLARIASALGVDVDDILRSEELEQPEVRTLKTQVPVDSGETLEGVWKRDMLELETANDNFSLSA